MVKLSGLLFFWITAVAVVHAATLSWDGEAGDHLWSNPVNWSGDRLPQHGDSVIIERERVVYDLAEQNGNLPENLKLFLKDGAELHNADVIRLCGAHIVVESGCRLSGANWWDLDGATMEFEDGAIVEVGQWEQKGINHFKLKLGADGFRALTPDVMRLGAATLPASMENATYTVDLADYQGGLGTIVLFDFGKDSVGMNNDQFQLASLNIINAGDYQAFLQWNDKRAAVELIVQGGGQTATLGLLVM